MRTVKSIASMLLVIGCTQSAHNIAGEPLSDKNSEAEKREAGYVYGVAYSAATLASRTFSFCEKHGLKNFNDIKDNWDTRNTISLRAALFMLSDSASSLIEEETAKEIIQIEANPTLEQYIKTNLTDSKKPNSACKKQMDLIEKGNMDIDRDNKTKAIIEEYKNKNIESFTAISEKITDQKIYQALAATIALKKAFYSHLNYCKKNFPSLDEVYEKYRTQWETDNNYQLNAANLLISLTYIGFSQSNKSEEANGFIKFIKDHSNNAAEKSTALLDQNKDKCKVIFNTYDQSLNLQSTAARGYEHEVAYITQSYKTYFLNNLAIPHAIDL